MKRRGFITRLFGIAAAPVAGVALAKAESKFPRGLLKETEPMPSETVPWSSYEDDMNCYSATVEPVHCLDAKGALKALGKK